MSRHTHPNPNNPPGSAAGAVSARRKGWRFRVLVAAIIASLPVTGCRRPADKTDAGSDAASIGGAGLNVLLISVDTTRADHLGCYGHPARHTPNIDRVAAEGTRFAQCVASTPVTLPSHATMLTGSYPFVHGVRDNGTFRLESANVTLAEIFRTAGYVTHAEVASTVMDGKYGLDQGFDTYGEVQRQAPPVLDEKTDAKLPLIEHMERKADDVTRSGIAFLEKNRGRPFFLFLHYYDPHRAYTAPERFLRRYANGYLAEIAFFDEQFGLLMESLRTCGLAERTLVVLTSDHGEGLGQHGEATHTFFVYDTTQMVPLILWCPGHVPAGQVVPSQVRLVDIAPTLVSFARLGPAPQMQGLDLLPLVADPRKEVQLACYGETLCPALSFGYAPLRFLRVEGWKYIHAPRPELYHVAADPHELADLAAKEPGRVQAMREELRSIIERSPPPPAGRVSHMTADPAEMEKLRALGYVGAGASEGREEELAEGSELDHFEPQGANPRDHMESIELLCDGIGALYGGNFVEAENVFRKLLALEPDNPRVLRDLGDALTGQDRLEDALGAYQASLQQAPDDDQTLGRIARLQAVRGEFEEAEAHYRQVIVAAPDQYGPHLGLAEVLSEQQRFDEAYIEYEAAAALAPDVAEVFLKWGMACQLAGRSEEAIDKLQRACGLNEAEIRYPIHLAQVLRESGRLPEAITTMSAIAAGHPDDPLVHRCLSEWLTESGEHIKATIHYQRAAELQPDIPQAWFNFALNLVQTGRSPEAVDAFRKAVGLQPDYLRAWTELATTLTRTGQDAEALDAWQNVLRISPETGSAYLVSAQLMARLGHAEKHVVDLLRRGHEQVPDDMPINNMLSWVLATTPDGSLQDGVEAVRMAERALQLAGDDPHVLDTLAAAYAAAGRFEDAVNAVDRALNLAQARSLSQLESALRDRRDLYIAGRPYRRPPPANAVKSP